MVNERMETRDPYTNRPYESYGNKRVSWSAIIMGALVALGLGFLLNLFGLAIGLSAFTPSQDGAATIAIGGFIGMLIVVIVTMGVAGYAAGYLGRHHCPQRNLGIIYGFCTWTLALILTVLIAGPITQHAMSLTSTAMSQQGGGTGATMQGGQQGQRAQEQGAQGQGAQMNQSSPEATQPSTWAWGVFMIFVLFFIGALSSCLGAIWGMKCDRND